jgi:SEC-C motif-containing protein
MQSRYSAYVLGDADYIIKTTNVNNPDYTLETISWKNDIIDFCTIGDFVSLEIIEFVEGDAISYVTFKVTLLLNAKDASFTEKSKFLKVNGAWQYHSAEIK